MQTTSVVEEWISAILRELNQHKGKVVAGFALVTFVVVILGFVWPKYYASSAIIYLDNQNIIKPLLKGQAEVTSTSDADQLEVVRQRITSNQVMEQVLLKAGMVKNLDNAPYLQQLIRQVVGGLAITSAGKDHIKIAYRSKDPGQAYKMASLITNQFIASSASSKRQESSEAYTFIDNQVKTYQAQLQAAEDRLKDFKTANPGVDAESVNSRMSKLRSDVESLTLDLQVAQARRDELRQQISHEKQYISKSYKVDVYRSALAEAQSKLDTLRLSYQETYPDIVSLKQQIEDLRKSIAQAESEPDSGGDQSSAANPVYQKLKSDLSDAEVNVKTLELKLASARKLLQNEIGNSKQSAVYQAKLSELTRDYSVTKQVYEDLLERKEKARMSVALDVEGQGLNYRIQEPPVFPTTPVGLRFVHFYLAAPFLGLLVPIGLLGAYIQLDPRIRFTAALHEALPEHTQVLAVIPHMTSSLDKRMIRTEWNYLAVIVGFVLAAYVIVAIVRLSGVI